MPKMNITHVCRWSVVAVGAWVFGASVVAQPRVPPPFIALQPDEIKSPDGATQTIIAGDPGKPGIYVVQNVFEPGRMSRPHFHDQDRYITVVSGTWWVALGEDGDTFNPDKMIPMKAGSFVFHPKGGHHFDGAKNERAVVRIMGMGPVRSTQLEGR